MTHDRSDAFAEALAEFTACMKWSPESTENERALVIGNLNGFVGFLRRNGYGMMKVRFEIVE